ncbi:sugar-binding transcriptional regulator [Halalkalibacter lacteus]|uniref:sugar-binding transcriptional regulator n=1 Tax=Halalkalibacter lacteus TaxID=3090663 RepID=UPI002FCA8D38
MEQNKRMKMIEAAKMYYILDYNQSEIAKKLGVSRPTVSRFLQQAKNEGIVQITIHDPTENIEALERNLVEKYQLQKVVVGSVPCFEEELIKKALGEKAAEYLYKTITDGDTIGVAWGTTIYHVAQELKQKYWKGVKVVQLKGGVSHSETHTYASEILHLFGKAFHTNPHHLPLPAIVDHVLVKRAMETDQHIRKILEMGRQANVAVFTVGVSSSDSLLFQLGYFSDEDAKIISSKAVGDISSRFFNEDGNICHPDLNSRTLGIELEELKRKEKSILVAGGAPKLEAIYGALKGRFANVLVTDQYTAKLLLDKTEDK